MRTQGSRVGALIGFAVIIGLLVCADRTAMVVPHAKAFQIKHTNCGGDRYRDPGGHPVREMCLAPPGFPGLPLASDPSGNTYNDARPAFLSAHWMWVREGTSDASIFVDAAAGCGDGTGISWFDDNERNNDWWESVATVNAESSNPPAIATTETDEATCVPFIATKQHIIASDIIVGNDVAYSVVNQSTLTDCLRPGTNHETLWMHEVGHAYGLSHENAAISVMRGNIPEMRNCHVAQGFHNYPFPDDIAGLMVHHTGFSGTKRNWAGTPWIRTMGGDSVPQQLIPVTSNTVFVGVTATIHSYYSTGGWPTSRLFLLPIFQKPTFNSTTKVWTLNATQLGSIINHQTDGTPAFAVESRTVNLGSTFGGAGLPVGSYRVWAQVDVSGTTTETDEGDNVFPTNVTLNRT